MAVKTNAIIQGVVARVSKRDIPAKDDRAAMSFTNLLVVGDYTLADVTLGRGVEAPGVGQMITALVEVDVYRQDDQITLIEYIDPVEVKK